MSEGKRTIETPKDYPEFSANRDDPFEVSFRNLIAKFYGEKVDSEVAAAVDYNKKTFPSIEMSDGTVLSESSHPWGRLAVAGLSDGRVDKPIKVETKLDPSKAYGREHAAPLEHKITINSPSKYEARTLNAIMQHEGGHVIYNPSDYSHNDDPTRYYENPQEFATELAHLQRQRFLKTGKRFDGETLMKYIDDQIENPDISKPFEEFASPTQKLLWRFVKWKKKIEYDKDEKAKQEMEEAFKVLPGLVENNLEEETKNMVKNYFSNRNNSQFV